MRETRAELKKLKARASELERKLKTLTDEVAEAGEQRNATSEVLQVISSSLGEVEPVFQAMLENATRLCEAKFGTLYLYYSDAYHPVALHNAPSAYAETRTRDRCFRPPPDLPLGRIIATKQAVQIDDAKATKSYIEGEPLVRTGVDLGGYRTVLAVPMLKNDELIGAISIRRQEVRPFTDKQIELVSRTSLNKRSSPSRTPACSTSCASRCSSRPPPPTCLRSSAARPSTCRSCWTRWSSRPRGSARQTERRSGSREGRYHLRASCGFAETRAHDAAIPSIRPELVDGRSQYLRKAKPFMSSMRRPTRNGSPEEEWQAFARFSECPSCEKEFRSVATLLQRSRAAVHGQTDRARVHLR